MATANRSVTTGQDLGLVLSSSLIVSSTLSKGDRLKPSMKEEGLAFGLGFLDPWDGEDFGLSMMETKIFSLGTVEVDGLL